MSFTSILRALVFGRKSPEKAAMEYCYKHGFTSGKNFQYNSGYPIDANWPWLISVGDNVTLASNVRLLAHDASTAKTGIRTKVGIVRIGNNVSLVRTALCFAIRELETTLLLAQVRLLHMIFHQTVYMRGILQHLFAHLMNIGKNTTPIRKRILFSDNIHGWNGLMYPTKKKLK